ncbi:hypothetical protein EMMF5_005615 [Cystobasidiomycetes sp. EMM_F5]
MAPKSSQLAYLAQLCIGLLAALDSVAARDATLGLSTSNLMKNGVSVGFLPAYGEKLGMSTGVTLNAMLPKPMAIIGAYAEVKPISDPTLKQLDVYIADILAQPKPYPVFNLALMPTSGAPSVNATVAQQIANRMKQINDMGIPVWLRFAHEMNGDWYAYGQKPAQFLAAWTLLANTVYATTNQTYMFWAPNSAWAAVDQIVGGWTPYWPDPSTVDIVGLSYYHYGGHDRNNLMPDAGEAKQVLGEFDSLFGSGKGKPVVLAETAASYTFDITTNTPAPGGGEEWAMKTAWLEQITNLHSTMPSYVALTWFEVIKDENAGQGTDIKREDFRMISGMQNVTASTIAYFQNAAAVKVPFVATLPNATTSTNSAKGTTNSTVAKAASATPTPKNGAIPNSISPLAQGAALALLIALSAAFSS